MKNNHKIFLSLIFTLLLLNTTSYSQLRPGDFIDYVEEQKTLNHVIEPLPDYYSYIDWTTGVLVTDYKIPITYNDINIGRTIKNLTEKLKKRIIQFTIGSAQKIRVSSIFYLENFLQRDRNMRLKVLSILYDKPIENSIIKDSFLQGNITIPLFGTNSITGFLYQNTRYREVTNYLQQETAGTQYYDTVIIDMIMFPNFQASLMPRILDTKGQVIYSVETVDPKIIYERGAVYFVRSITEALKHPIRGERVAYVLPHSTSGAFSSDLVLFDEDVQRIFGQQRTLNNLKQGKVIIVMPQETNLL